MRWPLLPGAIKWGTGHGYHINTHVGRCAQLCNLGVSRAETALYLPMEEIYLAQLKDRDPHNLNGALALDFGGPDCKAAGLRSLRL